MENIALVTGAGGFIGHHLVTYLKQKGYWVRGVDLKYPEFSDTEADEFLILDLRNFDACLKATSNVIEVYNLAADMGGIGYITTNLASIARNNVLINSHMLQASVENKIEKYFYSSSACIYPTNLQKDSSLEPLKESDAYPAFPEEGYGWEKLYAEKLCEYYYKDYGLETRIARFHNVYGPLGTFQGGKEKAPAALSRKISIAADGGHIEIWGDGLQTRSFMYIEDCLHGIYLISQSNVRTPLNLGTDRLVSINQLADTITEISGKNIIKKFDLSKPQGVRGRNSDNTQIKKLIGWSPNYSLKRGLENTYRWIDSQLNEIAQ